MLHFFKHTYIIDIGWITIKVQKWGQFTYKMKYITEYQIWYEIVTYGMGDTCAKLKSATLSA